MEETGEVNGAITLGTISVFTSVKKMWNSESVSARISIVLLSLVNLTLQRFANLLAVCISDSDCDS